ncbi:hypothetical protein K505DRAFT_239078 [Melanomma pulvis-pyrius CBS 109.77]|uniref:Uncharacterized protein n=1 Tax=Melanomma pulvis-pyrius CBS 109.77 TaxID=1314802 RepID=A0A6A6XGW5_9PLEO|nr:hypothetical protein K505DRAFT_239078 [Melanomma pulvis-pyrius CBS 109.77]
MAPYLLIILISISSGSSAADRWDDIANNLATNLAPILQLFGEQFTKQFLSESTSLLDNIIFAMAPLGILTAMVSIIRVCGSPVIRAFIGRAQERSGAAEAELCSSTGRDVCEMYQNGAITRVFGRPKILEFVHDSLYENFYRKKEWVEQNSDLSRRSGTTIDDDAEPFSDEYALNLNLMLNIGFKRPSQHVLRITTIFGILLQSSLIVFAIVVTYHLRLTKNGESPAAWALPSMIISTVLLCSGMFMCSFLIERSTTERTFSRCTLKDAHPRSTIHWIQPGGQVVGDQSLDSFAYSDSKSPVHQYISSWRKPVSQRDSKFTWIAIIITLAGFVDQFVGLRGVHSTVAIFQLCAIVLMSALRSLLRIQRLDGKDNRLSIWSADGPTQDHELDWLALQLGQETIAENKSSAIQRPPENSRALGNCFNFLHFLTELTRNQMPLLGTQPCITFLLHAEILTEMPPG